MKSYLASLLMLASLCQATVACAAPWVRLDKLGVEVLVPQTLVAQVRDELTDVSEGNTQCIKFYFRKGGRYAGEFCASTASRFLADRSVVAYEAIPEHSRPPEEPPSGLVAMSGVGQYPLMPFGAGYVKSFAATTDCDESNEAIYRPTSSCHVVAAVLDGKHFYSSFIVESHAARRAKVSIKDIELIWSTLRAR